LERLNYINIYIYILLRSVVKVHRYVLICLSRALWFNILVFRVRAFISNIKYPTRKKIVRFVVRLPLCPLFYFFFFQRLKTSHVHYFVCNSILPWHCKVDSCNIYATTTTIRINELALCTRTMMHDGRISSKPLPQLVHLISSDPPAHLIVC